MFTAAAFFFPRAMRYDLRRGTLKDRIDVTFVEEAEVDAGHQQRSATRRDTVMWA
jgi:hypothetical protein